MLSMYSTCLTKTEMEKFPLRSAFIVIRRNDTDKKTHELYITTQCLPRFLGGKSTNVYTKQNMKQLAVHAVKRKN